MTSSRSFDSTVLAGLHQHLLYLPADRRVNRTLHLHGFHHQQPVAFFNLLIQLHRHGGHHAGNGRADLAGLRGIGLAPRLLFRLQAAVAHRDFSRLTVQLEEHRACAVGVRLAHRQELDHQRLAGLELHRNLLAALHAVVELRRGQHLHVALGLARLANFRKTSGYIR